MKKYLPWLVFIASCLAFFIIMLGAYTRLTDAGLGCPDWPGCYGHLNVAVTKTLSKTNGSIEFVKALTEMVHRYFAGTLGLIIVFLAGYAMRAHFRQESFPLFIPLLLLGLVCFQAALGMWTVTLKLLPVVVMSHLLGGLSLLCTLWWLFLSLSSQRSTPVLRQHKHWVLLGLAICVMQVALGGWVSSNYAGISCVGFPFCNGQLIPALDFSHAFNLFTPIGHNYQGGALDIVSRMTIQFVHRLGAILTATYVLSLSVYLYSRGQIATKKMALASMVIVCGQFMLGVINVVYMLPLKAAVLHNGVAALLLLSLLTLTYHAYAKGERACL